MMWFRPNSITARPLLLRRSSFATYTKVRPVRIRAITMDITGTLVSFRGSLQEHYLGSAAKCGVHIENLNKPIEVAFHQAYKEVSHRFPCFGHDLITGKEWWKYCVQRSLQLAGAEMSDEQAEQVFQRIYSVFGSQVAYERFDDAVPFLRWAHRNQISCGLLSNADDRYGDSILPMLGLTRDELLFQCFSKDYGLEKPDSRFFTAAISRANESLVEFGKPQQPLEASQVLHIGNDFNKDFAGARRAGMHAVLLDRYDEPELSEEWRRRGAIVLKDLMDVIEFLSRSECEFGDGSDGTCKVKY